MNRLISTIGMISTLVIAYASDRALDSLRRAAAQALSPSVVLQSLWVAAAVNLILAACILLLAWFVGMRSHRSTLIATLFLVVGLLILLSPSLSPLVAPIICWPLPFGFPPPDSLLFHAAAFVAVIGIVNLIVRR